MKKQTLLIITAIIASLFAVSCNSDASTGLFDEIRSSTPKDGTQNYAYVHRDQIAGTNYVYILSVDGLCAWTGDGTNAKRELLVANSSSDVTTGDLAVNGWVRDVIKDSSDDTKLYLRVLGHTSGSSSQSETYWYIYTLPTGKNTETGALTGDTLTRATFNTAYTYIGKSKSTGIYDVMVKDTSTNDYLVASLTSEGTSINVNTSDALTLTYANLPKKPTDSSVTLEPTEFWGQKEYGIIWGTQFFWYATSSDGATHTYIGEISHNSDTNVDTYTTHRLAWAGFVGQNQWVAIMRTSLTSTTSRGYIYTSVKTSTTEGTKVTYATPYTTTVEISTYNWEACYILPANEFNSSVADTEYILLTKRSSSGYQSVHLSLETPAEGTTPDALNKQNYTTGWAYESRAIDISDLTYFGSREMLITTFDTGLYSIVFSVSTEAAADYTYALSGTCHEGVYYTATT